ncbi:MAG TPA: EamA family transporter [Methylomirabilota bacterium]|nr:EamA family transporter [Methylomirabilota bacterium]
MLEIWFLYALTSVVFFGFTTIVDKLMLENRFSSFSYFITFAPPALVFSIWVFAFQRTVLSLPYAFAFVAGLISAGGYFLYVVSIRAEEASRVAALTSLYPAFVAVLAVFLVNEIFPAGSYLGIILMILGTILISYKRNHVRKIVPLSLVIVLIATNFCYSLDQILSKISLDHISFWPFLMMFMLGRFFVVFPSLALSSVRRKFISEIERLERKFALLLVLGSSMWSIALIFYFYAASLGPITLVSTTALISPLFTLLFAILITKYLPKVLEEEIDGRTVAMKLVAIVLICVGTYLIMT